MNILTNLKNKIMDKQVTAIIGGIVRHIVTVASGAFVFNGYMTDSQVETIAAGITALVVIGWSVWQKRNSAK
jgi:hypothetical protein